MRTGLLDCFRGVVAQDAARVVRGLATLGFISATADRAPLERVVGALLSRFGRLPAGRVREVNPREVLGDVETSVYDNPIRLPAEFAFFGRMAGMLLGLTVALSPRFNFVEVATPYAQRFLRRDGLEGILSLLGVDDVQSLGRDLLRESLATLRSLAELPQRLDRVLERAERGELNVVVRGADLTPAARARSTQRVTRRLLARPVPLWLPLGVLGALSVTRLILRATSSQR